MFPITLVDIDLYGYVFFVQLLRYKCRGIVEKNLLNTAAARTKSPSDLNASSAYWKADICLYQLEGEEILEEVRSNANSIFQDLKDTLMEYVPIEEIEDSESNEEEELLSQFSANMEFLKENNFGKDDDTEV